MYVEERTSSEHQGSSMSALQVFSATAHWFKAHNSPQK